MATILSSCPWQHEPALLPLPWNETYTLPPPTPTKPLRIALMPHDGVVLPHPPITRALRAVEAKLRALSNVEIVPWRPHAHDEAWAIASSLYYPDGGAADMAVMDATGEPLLPLTKWMLEANPCVRRLSMPQLEYWLEEREAFRSEYAAVWNATATAVEEGTGVLRGAVDVLLCPAAPHVAPRSGSSRYWAYSCVWNLLDWPAVVFPVCRVDKAVDGVVERERGKGQWMSGEDERNWGLCEYPSLSLTHTHRQSQSQLLPSSLLLYACVFRTCIYWLRHKLTRSTQGTQIPSTACPSRCSSWRAGARTRSSSLCSSISSGILGCRLRIFLRS